MPLSIQEIVKAISTHTDRMPKAAFREAVAQKDIIVPELLQLLADAAADVEALSQRDDYMGHISAMYLLAQFREARAHPYLVQLVSADIELLDEVLGEIVTDGLERLLASTCGGDCTLLRNLIENKRADEYVRGAALRALVICVAEGEVSRDEVIGYFRELFRGKLNTGAGMVWSFLVSGCCDLYPEELMTDIELAYARDLVDPGFISKSSVKRSLDAGRERTLAKLKTQPDLKFIHDVLKDLPW